ncbi:hypothetical protein AMB3_3605 [plant metagenome]|uniref:Uncharacterized protein n=1 Tax=plant metagenome TaxID=1297885 RepID=A0A484P1N9_9ZZZZ
MNKTRAQSKPTGTPEKAAAAGRVFKFSLKGIPAVDAAMEARLEAAARTPRKDRRYPVMIEAPDA